MKNNRIYFHMILPFTYIINWTDDPIEPWTIRVKELEGCMSHGLTPLEAMANIPYAMDSYILATLSNGDKLEKPDNLEKCLEGLSIEKKEKILKIFK